MTSQMPDEPRHYSQILLVEDEPTISKLMEVFLDKEKDWKSTTVGCGANAVEAWNNGNFDLILMDLGLPRMDGIQATQQIRDQERRSGRKHTPIIAFTAKVSEADRQRCLEAGMDDFIAKPTKMKDVIDIVYKYLPDTSSSS